MGENVRFLIIPARHDTSVPPLSKAAVEQQFITGARSVFAFWRDTTYGYFDFSGSIVAQPVDIAVTPTATERPDIPRGVQVAAAVAAVRARGWENPDDFEHVLVVTTPGWIVVPNPDPGKRAAQPTVTLWIDGGARGKTAALPVNSSDHTFMSHEVGHTLGFTHTMGIPNTGADWDGPANGWRVTPEYGSPFDVMSSATFGSSDLGIADPTFQVPRVPDWPRSGPLGAGPELSRANLLCGRPDALASRCEQFEVNASNPRAVARVWASTSGSGSVAICVAEHSMAFPGLVVEFRTPSGWDQGIEYASPDLARAGVVVHTVDLQSGELRATYRGGVPSGGVDRDVTVPSTPFVVTVLREDPESRWADIAVSLTTERRVTLLVEEPMTTKRVGSISVTGTALTPCAQQIRVGTYVTSSRVRYRLEARGVGAEGAPQGPPVNWGWIVGGTSIAPGGSAVVSGVTCVSSGTSLALVSGPGVVADLTVTGVVDDGVSAQGEERFLATGVETDAVHPDDELILADCLDNVFKRRFDIRRSYLPIPWWLRTAQWQERAVGRMRVSEQFTEDEIERIARLVLRPVAEVHER